MSKETTIIFLYDTELLKREEDDPNSAILYFYPTWVSDQQKTALCGQLIGTILCLKSILAMPKTVSLQTGKFFLIENGRYILVVGTDRNIPDWVLEHRATLIYSLVKFFHKDFVTLAELYRAENLTTKLYHIFDTYLKLLFLGGCIFSHMPLLDLSKTEINILTNARIFLDKCKTFPNILGGMLLYQNKIIHTQLSAHISKKIAFSDPFRIKNPAELSDFNFEIPQGIKLLQVYIPNEEYQDLLSNNSTSCSEGQSLNSIDIETTAISEASCSTPLKRDKSLLFTSVPEDATFSPHKEATKNKSRSNKKRSRPNSLNLKSYSLDSTGDCGLGTPITPYWSQSSAVCTPMSETKSFVDQPDVRINNKDSYCDLTMGFHKMNLSQQDSNNSIFRYPNSAKTETCKYYHHTTCFSCPLEVYTRRLEKAERLFTFVQAALAKQALYRSSSLRNLSPTNSISNPLNRHQYSNFRSNNTLLFQSKSINNFKRWKSIHDPLYPWFKGEQAAASQYYVEDVLDDGFFVGKNQREEISFRELITERKRSLTLPIKPHNASEPQRTDVGTSGGYSTPLMNKLSMPNSFEGQHSSKETPLTPFLSQNVNEKTEEGLQKCILFMYGDRDLVLASVLTEKCLKNKIIIEKLRQLCTQELPTLQEQIVSCAGPPKSATSSGLDPYSVLSVDSNWDTLKRAGLWDESDLADLTRLHGDFKEHQDTTDIYLRKPESVLFGHREGSTEFFYQEAASVNQGMLPPNDALGSVHQTAKKKLEMYHDVFIK